MHRAHLFFLAALTATGAVAAQSEYRQEQNDALHVRFKVFGKLHAVPLQLGGAYANLRAKYEPKDPGDYIYGAHGTFAWQLYLFEFPKAGATAKTEGEGAKEPAADAHAPGHRGGAAKDFLEFVTSKDPSLKERAFDKANKNREVKAHGKTPDCHWWEYTDTIKMTNGVQQFDQLWYTCAAVYDFPEREVVLTCTVPVKHGVKPEPNHRKWMETMLQSLEPAGDAADTDSAGKEKFADTPERKAELDKAKANIANLAGWDYFTTPNYIVLFAWDDKAADKRGAAVKFAHELVDRLEEMRKLYAKEYPPHDQMLKLYSVLRVCNDYEQFRQYGSTSPGVVGYFNPNSHELVVFDDKERLFGKKSDTIYTTTMHEGWHQYAYTYFGERAELHRWFDEGTGDYFGSFQAAGKGWDYRVEKGRFQGIREQVARKTYIPPQELVTWEVGKFYGSPRVVDHYEQAYSMVDFLRRGARMGKKFDPAWSKILDTYRTKMLATRDHKQAVEAAFAGVDWTAWEATWLEWVTSYMNK